MFTYVKNQRKTSLRMLNWKEILHFTDNITECKKKKLIKSCKNFAV